MEVQAIGNVELIVDASRTAGKWILAHFSMLAVIVPASMAAVSLLITSYGDPTIMLLLVSSLSVKTLVLSAILQGIPGIIFPGCMLAIVVFHVNASTDSNRSRQWRFWEGISIASALFLALFAPILSVIWWAGSLVFMIVSYWVLLARISALRLLTAEAGRRAVPWSWPKPRMWAWSFNLLVKLWKLGLLGRRRQTKGVGTEISRPKSRGVIWTLFGFSAVIVMFGLASGRPLPVESVQLVGQSPRVASVVTSDSTTVTFLYAGTPNVAQVRRSQIVSESYCDQRPGLYGISIIYLLGNRTPPC